MYIENGNIINIVNATFEECYSNEFQPMSGFVSLANLINEVHFTNSNFMHNRVKNVKILQNKLPSEKILI